MKGERGILTEHTGQRFGRLLVLRVAHRDHELRYHWLCRCDCGKEVVKNGRLLRDGRTQSCGCYRKEKISEIKTTHGDSRTSRVYSIWNGMHARCYNPRNRSYKNYGGRGISVCERWHVYENFRADMGASHRGELSIDRYPDKNGNYEPSNCRWATHKQQSRNQRTNRLIPFMGETLNLSAWAERMNVPSERIRNRLDSGWIVDRAMTEPPRGWSPGKPKIA